MAENEINSENVEEVEETVGEKLDDIEEKLDGSIEGGCGECGNAAVLYEEYVTRKLREKAERQNKQ